MLDVRPVTHTMLLVTGNHQYASNAISWTGDDGTSFIGKEPRNPQIIETNLRFPIDRFLAEGVLFVPEEMEYKLAIFYHRSENICVHSWAREVLLVARVEEHDDHILVKEVRGSFFITEQEPELTVRALDYVLRSHALEIEYPAPLPAGMEQNRQTAAEWCMSYFGNRVAFATPHQIVRQDPDKPLRTLSLMHIGAARGDSPMIEVQLAAGVPIDLLDADGITPLHWATQSQDPAIVTFLLERGSPVDVRSIEGETPLMAAVQSAGIEKVTILLDRGAYVNAADQRGATSLHRAAEMGHANIVRVLLDRGASPNREAMGHTPRSIAEARGWKEIVALLDEYIPGANLA